MPQVAVAVVGTIIGGAVSGGITGAVIMRAVVSGVLAGASMLLQKKPKSGTVNIAGTTITGYGADNPRQIIYGKAKVGGTVFFQHSTGSSNEYLHLCIAFSGHKIEDFETIYFGSYALAIDGIGNVGVGTSSDGSTVDYTGNAWVYKHLGEANQTADANLIAEAPDKWTTQHTASGVAYLYVRLKYNSTVFSSGLPQITAVIRGKSDIYDPRMSSYGYTNNSALCLADYLHTYQGASADEVYNSYLNVAANICDETITNADGSTQARWTANGSLDTSSSPEDFISQLRSTMAGLCPYVGDGFKFYAGAWRTPESTGLTESDFIGPPTIQTSISRSDLFNGVKGTYLSPINNYEVSDFPSVKSDTYMAQDGGQRLWSDLTLAFVNSPSQAQRIAKIELLRMRQPITIQVKTPLNKCKFIIGDIIPVTYARMGWSGKYFEINNMEFALDTDANSNPFISVNLTLRETASAIYEWTTDEESAVDIAPNTNLPSPYNVLAPTNFAVSSGTADLYVRTDGTVITRAHLTWTPASWASVQSGGYYDVEYKPTASAVWSAVGNPSGSQDNLYINDVKDGLAYDFRIRSVSILGNVSPWSSISNYTVLGKTEAPNPPTDFLVRRLADGTRQFTWVAPSDTPDLMGYEIRYSTNTSAAWSAMTKLNDGVLVYSPWETNQLSANTYLFSIKSIDTSGNYSATSSNIIATIADPRLADAIDIITAQNDGWPSGTFTDCYVEPSTNWIVPNTTQQWSGLSTWSSWTSFLSSAVSPIAYEYPMIDIGGVLAFTPYLSSSCDGTPTYTINYSIDNVTWSGWVSPAPITARYLKIKISVAGTTPIIKTFEALLDGKVISEDIADLNTATIASPAGDLRLPLSKTYTVIRNVSLTLQNVGAGWSWEIIDKNNTSGPRVKIYNASNTLANAVIDATIRGF